MFANLDSEMVSFILRIALVFDLAFTVLSYRIVVSYKTFQGLTRCASVLKRYVHVGFARTQDDNELVIDDFSTFTLIILALVLAYLFIFQTSAFWKIMLFPTKPISFAFTIWQRLPSPWLVPVYLVLTLMLVLIGIFLTLFAWGFILAIPTRAVGLVGELLYTRVSRRLFEAFVLSMFFISWGITFWSTFV